MPPVRDAGKGPARDSGKRPVELMAALISKRQKTEEEYISRIAAAQDAFNEGKGVLAQVFDMPESNSLKAKVAESIASRMQGIVADVLAELSGETPSEVRSWMQLSAGSHHLRMCTAVAGFNRSLFLQRFHSKLHF